MKYPYNNNREPTVMPTDLFDQKYNNERKAEMMKCWNCGHWLQDGAQYCTNCGTSVETTRAMKSSASTYATVCVYDELSAQSIKSDSYSQPFSADLDTAKSKVNSLCSHAISLCSNGAGTINYLKKCQSYASNQKDKVYAASLNDDKYARSISAPKARKAKFKSLATSRRVINANRIDIKPCIKETPDTNDDFLSKTKMRANALSDKAYRHYYSQSILKKYLFSYKKLVFKASQMNHVLPSYLQIHVPKVMSFISYGLYNMYKDYLWHTRGAHGEAEVVHTLQHDNGIPCIQDVNLPYFYNGHTVRGVKRNQIDVLSVNTHGVFLFEVKSYNQPYVWIDKNGRIGWSKTPYGKPHYQTGYNPIFKQVRNHKLSFLYNVHHVLHLQLNPKDVHNVVVFINNNRYHTRYLYNRSAELDNTPIDQVAFQDDCAQCVHGSAIFNHRLVNGLRDLRRRYDRPYPHYELYGDYRNTLRNIREFVHVVDSLFKKYSIIFDDDFINTRKSIRKNIRQLSNKLSQYRQAKNGTWYIHRDYGRPIFLDTKQSQEKLQNLINNCKTWRAIDEKYYE